MSLYLILAPPRTGLNVSLLTHNQDGWGHKWPSELWAFIKLSLLNKMSQKYILLNDFVENVFSAMSMSKMKRNHLFMGHFVHGAPAQVFIDLPALAKVIGLTSPPPRRRSVLTFLHWLRSVQTSHPHPCLPPLLPPPEISGDAVWILLLEISSCFSETLKNVICGLSHSATYFCLAIQIRVNPNLNGWGHKRPPQL